ncbi:hypothetical protein ACKI16_29260 [Streptomyces scabiei]|uniref:hypothetical protein n=1 Tax=Streptomyces scabiei TaxID=1930 RepID=UPI0038F6013D
MTTVDVEDIERAYNAGVVVFMRAPETRAGVLQLSEELRGYVDLLMPEATAVTPRMRGEARLSAVHFLTRARQILAELDDPAQPVREGPLDGPPLLGDRELVFELACLCRTALTVVRRPGPLGQATGLREIEEAVNRRVCGACWLPIADGEPTERKVFLSEAGPGIRGFVHAELCVPRRPLLVSVPVQPTRV